MRIIDNSIMKNIIIIYAIVSLMTLTVLADPLASFLATSLFVSGEDGVESFRIPGVVVTSKGTILAYCEARKLSSSDYGEIEVYLRRSADGGHTWDKARQIAHHGGRLEGNPRKGEDGWHEQTVNNPVAVVDHVLGSITLIYFVNYEHCYSIRSLDDGITWGSPVEITSVFQIFRKEYDWNVIAAGPGHGIQLQSGRLVIPVWLAYGGRGEHRPSVVATIYSDDHGKTWVAGAIAVPNDKGFNNPNEAAVAELSDTRLMLIVRNESAPNRKIIAISEDGGTQWMSVFFHDDLPEAVCMASVVSYTNCPGILIYSGVNSVPRDKAGQEIPGDKARPVKGVRHNLSIKISRNDGETWSAGKVLHEGPSAYSDLAVLPDGRIVCFYEAGLEYPYEQLVLAVFDKVWEMKKIAK